MNWGSVTEEAAWRWAGLVWATMFVVWVALWFRMKRAKKQETSLQVLQHAIPVTLGFWLMFGKLEPWGWLNARLLPVAPASWFVGLSLTVLGMAVSISARLSLGGNWSGVVTLKEGHELVRTGFYRWIRHPIYSGILLGMIGTAMIRNYLRYWIAFLLVLTTFYVKARREERFLRQEFGARFAEHARETGMFLPKWT